MAKKYVNDENLQIGMTEYNSDLKPEAPVFTEQGNLAGKVAKVYDNENGNGEQVYAVVPDQKQVLEWGMV